MSKKIAYPLDGHAIELGRDAELSASVIFGGGTTNRPMIDVGSLDEGLEMRQCNPRTLLVVGDGRSPSQRSWFARDQRGSRRFPR